MKDWKMKKNNCWGYILASLIFLVAGLFLFWGMLKEKETFLAVGAGIIVLVLLFLSLYLLFEGAAVKGYADGNNGNPAPIEKLEPLLYLMKITHIFPIDPSGKKDGANIIVMIKGGGRKFLHYSLPATNLKLTHTYRWTGSELESSVFEESKPDVVTTGSNAPDSD